MRYILGLIMIVIPALIVGGLASLYSFGAGIIGFGIVFGWLLGDLVCIWYADWAKDRKQR